MIKKPLYFGYIVIGILYLAVKIIYVLAGYLHVGAIAHGAVPAVLTTVAGIFVIRENIAASPKLIWHRLVIILPLFVLVITPLYMYVKQGDMWLANGRLSVFLIYECLAIMQFVAAVGIRRKSIRIKP